MFFFLEPSEVTNLNLSPPMWNLETNFSNPNTALTINFTPPCSINGKFKQYEIHFTGSRKEYDIDYRVQKETTMNVLQSVTLDLLPDRTYEFHISVVTEFYNTTVFVASMDTKPGGKTINFVFQYLLCLFNFFLLNTVVLLNYNNM